MSHDIQAATLRPAPQLVIVGSAKCAQSRSAALRRIGYAVTWVHAQYQTLPTTGVDAVILQRHNMDAADLARFRVQAKDVPCFVVDRATPATVLPLLDGVFVRPPMQQVPKGAMRWLGRYIAAHESATVQDLKRAFPSLCGNTICAALGRAVSYGHVNTTEENGQTVYRLCNVAPVRVMRGLNWPPVRGNARGTDAPQFDGRISILLQRDGVLHDIGGMTAEPGSGCRGTNLGHTWTWELDNHTRLRRSTKKAAIRTLIKRTSGAADFVQIHTYTADGEVTHVHAITPDGGLGQVIAHPVQQPQAKLTLVPPAQTPQPRIQAPTPPVVPSKAPEPVQEPSVFIKAMTPVPTMAELQTLRDALDAVLAARTKANEMQAKANEATAEAETALTALAALGYNSMTYPPK